MRYDAMSCHVMSFRQTLSAHYEQSKAELEEVEKVCTRQCCVDLALGLQHHAVPM